MAVQAAVPTTLIILATVLALSFPVSVAGKERLPPHAYFNRTIYPPIYPRVREPHVSVGLISDVQYAEQEEHKRRHFRLSPGKLQHAVKEMNANRTYLDFVVHLGDLVDHSMSTYLPKLKPILSQLNYPLYQVLGNHDYAGTDEKMFGELPGMLGMPGRYYTFTAGHDGMYRFIVMDGNDISLYATVTGSEKRRQAEQILQNLKNKRAKNANGFNGAISSEQIKWMKKEIEAACSARQRVIIMLHHPMRPKGEPTNLWNDYELVPIITSYRCVAAVVNGHAHKFLYDYHATSIRNVHFITFGGMVQSPFTSFGYMELYDDVIHVYGLIFGRAINYTYDIRPLDASGSKHVPAPAYHRIRQADKQSVMLEKAFDYRSDKRARAPKLVSAVTPTVPYDNVQRQQTHGDGDVSRRGIDVAPEAGTDEGGSSSSRLVDKKGGRRGGWREMSSSSIQTPGGGLGGDPDDTTPLEIVGSQVLFVTTAAFVVISLIFGVLVKARRPPAQAQQ